MKIDIKGFVVDRETGEFYDYFGVKNTNPGAMQKALDEADGEDIELSIASDGGDVFAAAEIYTMLMQYDGKVTGIIQGLAASAASVIAEACDNLVISPVGAMMIHRAAGDGWGNAEDFNHQSKVLDKVDQTIISAYQAKTGKSRDDILDLMSAETWMTAKDAVENGFADEILSTNSETPQFTNSLGMLPDKKKVNDFMNFMMKSHKPKEKQVNKETKSNTQADNSAKNAALFNTKLKILKGELNA